MRDEEIIVKLIVKLNKTERAIVERRAKARGQTSSNYIRALLRADIGSSEGNYFQARAAGRPRDTQPSSSN